MVAIYCDGADLPTMRKLACDDAVQGFTTNPSLMRKAGVRDYRQFAQAVLEAVDGKPVSFEVLADAPELMERQAYEIAHWGANVYVKVPVVTSEGAPTYDLIYRLVRAKVNVNVTAVFTATQCRFAIDALDGTGVLSVFAGRIADTGVDPERVMRAARAKIGSEATMLLWASAREVYNVKQAEEAGCDIITLSPDLIAKLAGFGRNLTEYSIETARQFFKDAAGYVL